MEDRKYKAAKIAAIKELEELLELQRATEQRIVNLRNMISSLDALSGDPKNKPESPPRLTNAIRSIFKAAPTGTIFTASDVRDRLVMMGFKEAGYSRFLASIHVVLKRLFDKGELRRNVGTGGVSYQTKPMEDLEGK